MEGPIDLDALDDYLMSDRAPDDSMGLSDLDGFLTGIVVGPELIMPSEWLPVIWGGEEPIFQTDDEMRTVLGTIMERYNEIAACLNSDQDDFVKNRLTMLGEGRFGLAVFQPSAFALVHLACSHGGARLPRMRRFLPSASRC